MRRVEALAVCGRSFNQLIIFKKRNMACGPKRYYIMHISDDLRGAALKQ